MDTPSTGFTQVFEARKRVPHEASRRFAGRVLARDAAPRRAGSSAAILLLSWVVAGAAALSAGCNQERGIQRGGTSGNGSDATPGLDVRGGETDTTTRLGNQAFVAFAGRGGSIRVSSSGGDITVSAADTVTVPQVPDFIGERQRIIDVRPGQTLHRSGAFDLDYLRVQTGGVLVLDGDSFFFVAGDVEIAGAIRAQGNRRSSRGRNVTIEAGGIINITGTVDSSGFTPEDPNPDDRELTVGGPGGSIFISSLELAAVAPGPHIFVSGVLRADGGSVKVSGSILGAPGSAGSVTLGASGDITIVGRASARGGVSDIPSAADTGLGGSVEIIAAGDIELARMLEINANGGSTSGTLAADGGTVLFEAPLGTLRLLDTNVECAGGDATFTDTSVAGNGGSVTFSADGVVVSDATLNASAGEPEGEAMGTGGNGGTIQLAGFSELTVLPGSLLDAEGGRTTEFDLLGGAGGSIKVVGLNELNPAVITFEGTASVLAGRDLHGVPGPAGTICQRGAGNRAIVNLTGSNASPPSSCSVNDLENFVVHDLDCDGNTIIPDQVATDLPPFTGLDFFRIRAPIGVQLTISLQGGDEANLNLFAGIADALGSTNVNDYTFSSTEPGSNEEIEIDLGDFDAGAFVSVWVVEQSGASVEYTLGVNCAEEEE